MPRGALEALEGQVRGNGRTVGYGRLVSGLRRVEAASTGAPRTPPARWRHGGHPAARATGHALVTGAHLFPSDLTRPGILHGRVLHPHVYSARLRSVDVEGARAIAGVTVVHEGDFVGVAAADRDTAERALAAIQAQWSLPGHPAERDLDEHLRSHPVEVLGWQGAVDHHQGDVERALATAGVRVAATYTTAFIAHVALETRIALAEWDEGRVTVWTGTQQPFFVRYELAAELGVPEEQVRVIVPDTGGGFGGKHTEAQAIAAARLARVAEAPVRVALSREEEFRFTYVRPASVIDVRSAAGRDGTITAWDFHNVNSGAAGLAPPYNVADQRTRFQPADSPLPQGPYRALASTANHFARESHIDELAQALGLDPVELRLRNLTDERLAAVLLAASEGAWCKRGRSNGRGGYGTGIACGVEKEGRVATRVDVRVSGDQLEILRIVTAYECGAIVNPATVEGQIEGAIVMGLGGALFEAVHFDGGRMLNASMHSYGVPRFSDVPPIEVILLDRPRSPPPARARHRSSRWRPRSPTPSSPLPANGSARSRFYETVASRRLEQIAEQPSLRRWVAGPLSRAAERDGEDNGAAVAAGRLVQLYVGLLGGSMETASQHAHDPTARMSHGHVRASGLPHRLYGVFRAGADRRRREPSGHGRPR